MVIITSFKHIKHTQIQHWERERKEKNQLSISLTLVLPLIHLSTTKMRKCEFTGWTHFWVFSSLLSIKIADLKQFKHSWIKLLWPLVYCCRCCYYYLKCSSNDNKKIENKLLQLERFFNWFSTQRTHNDILKNSSFLSFFLPQHLLLMWSFYRYLSEFMAISTLFPAMHCHYVLTLSILF